MDKNMIHIDDLVRQRLNGEEQERAGAWLRMKDLLDKDMPVRPVAGIGWGKKLLFSAAMLAVIATVGLTGYEVASSFRGTADNNVTAVAHPSYATNKATDKSVTVTTTAQSEATPADDNQSAKNAIVPNTASDKALNPTTTTTATNVDVKFKSADKTKNRTKNNNTNKTTTTNSIANNTSNTVNNNQPQQTTSSANTNNANNSSSQNNTTASNNRPQLPGQRTVAVNTPDNAPAQKNEEPTFAKTETVPTVNKVEKVTVDPINNTASYTEVVTGSGQLERTIPGSSSAGQSSQELVKQETEMMPAAKAPFGPPPDDYVSTSDNVIASANNSKNDAGGHKHKTKSGVSVWQSISEYFGRAQYTLGSTKINTGVIGGLNKTFGNYGQMGVNVGLFSDFMFSETWGARIEAKYMHWFNQGTTYRNDYNSYTQEGNLYNQYKNDHTFKYSTMWNADVPVMVQYRPYKSNVAIFAGANLSYYSKLVPQETNLQTLVATGLTSAPNVAAPMTVADFNSRFGMGAMLGVGYNLNDMMQVGLRISQPFSDNAKGANAQQVSKDLYRTPNLQLNFSYRFGKDKKDN